MLGAGSGGAGGGDGMSMLIDLADSSSTLNGLGVANGSMLFLCLGSTTPIVHSYGCSSNVLEGPSPHQSDPSSIAAGVHPAGTWPEKLGCP